MQSGSGTFNISAPSKTFMLGEYACLNGAPALIVNTTPRFQLEVTPQNHWEFHPKAQSPSLELINLFKSLSSRAKFKFFDPHASRGGFGASSAEFLLYYKAMMHLSHTPFSKEDAWDLYRLLHERKQLRTSGSDLMTQATGFLNVVSQGQSKIILEHWNANISFELLRTGIKVKTFEHLKNLPKFDASSLASLSTIGIQALIDHKYDVFCAILNNFQKALENQGLTHPNTLSLLQVLRKLPGVLACKGCGSLGADVVLVMLSTEHRHSFIRFCQKTKLQRVATEMDLSSGLRFEENYELA